MKFKEIETKYFADDISLKHFHSFCKERHPCNYIQASGYDHFYVKPGEDDSFWRHRIGPDMNQWTFKRKTKENNNFVRTEINIDLKENMDQEHVAAACTALGYEYNRSLFKTCFVYQYDWYTLVYYICYDENMEELKRFVEIELNEDKAWESDEAAWSELVVLEKLCKTLGLSAQARCKLSLFEMFRKRSK